LSRTVELSGERKDRYLEKIEKMENRISNVDGWIGDVGRDGFTEDEMKKLAVYKAFQELVEAATDVCAMYLADRNGPVGDDYENIEKASGKLYSEGMEDDLKRANGLRNRVVHEYNGLRDEVAYSGIEELLPSLEKFKEEVLEWIREK